MEGEKNSYCGNVIMLWLIDLTLEESNYSTDYTTKLNLKKQSLKNKLKKINLYMHASGDRIAKNYSKWLKDNNLKNYQKNYITNYVQ